MNEITYQSSIGTFTGLESEYAYEFSGIPYAKAERFEYSELIDSYEGVFDAGKMGNSCPQYRQFYPHLDVPERLFYHKEFRQGIDFHYDEDCLNLNIYTPKNAKNAPVILYFHGGGFNSGSNNEEPFRGYEYAKRGIITVFANYRVGVLGYFSHEEIQKKYGRNGNFGLDDMCNALRWVRAHIEAFGGNKDNISLMGQSAGAMSIQYLCLNHDLEGMFDKAILMSGGGLFPKIACPKKAEDTYSYWKELMMLSGCLTFEEFKKADLQKIHDAYEEIKKVRKDSVQNMMPVVDGVLIKDDVNKLMSDPLHLNYMIGYTNNDLYAPLMAFIGNKYARDNSAYVYYFDVDAPGDKNAAFHSGDLRYMFGRLDTSWRPYTEEDKKVSKQMMDYLANFVKKGDPNGKDLPVWHKTNKNQSKVLCIQKDKTKMGKASYLKLTKNLLTKGEPKA